MGRLLHGGLSGVCFVNLLSILAAAELPELSKIERQPASCVAWLSDYALAMDAAEAQRKMTLLWFYDPKAATENARFAKEVLSQDRIEDLIERQCVAVKVPLDAHFVVEGKEVQVLRHAAFAEMRGRPGLAMVDMTDKESPLFRRVVSAYPFGPMAITAENLTALLELPRGTLTQRTLIFAVRTHPEHPASAASRCSPLLAEETESHAQHQASITLQGHHNWESRFQAINARLPGGLVAQEVCAESWPGQNLVEAAEECVDSWRQSPGHWSAVSGASELFGYDMKRGRNGVWYAAGIFAHRH
jgi:hypothetical protein